MLLMALEAKVGQNTNLNYFWLPTDGWILHTSLIYLLQQRFVSTFSLCCLQDLIKLFHFAVPKPTTSWWFPTANCFGREREHEVWQPKTSRLPQFFELCMHAQGCNRPVRDPTIENWWIKCCIFPHPQKAAREKQTPALAVAVCVSNAGREHFLYFLDKENSIYHSFYANRNNSIE